MVRALGLLSGGLDSILAARLLLEQGIKVIGLSFETPFFSAKKAREAAERLGIPLVVRDITGPHLEMMKAPPHGFGSNMNPCIDCHALMLKVAREIMTEEGFDFVFTGEVLNERPMSQNRRALRTVEKASGCEGVLLRPLSAKLLDETLPEREGKVDRERLLGLHGRTRRPQMELARKYGIDRYPAPAGGCLLTDPGFSTRLRDLRDREGLDDVRLIRLLRTGRHFRLAGGRKAVAGRNEAENGMIEELSNEADSVLTPRDVPGPTVLVPGGGNQEETTQAARILARYSDATPGDDVAVYRERGGEKETLLVACPAPEEIEAERI